ncbi:hypothetical protein ACTVZP_17705 [Rhodobacter sp. NSM]
MTGAVPAAATPPEAVQPDFTGPPNELSHETRWFDFRTDAAAGEVYRSINRSFWVQVQNDSDNDLRIIWHIAGVDGWVEPGSDRAWPRDLVVGSERQINVFTSCVSYGNRGSDHVTATLIGPSWEIQPSQEQVDAQCAGLEGRPTLVDPPPATQETEIFPFSRFYDFIFPSSLDEPGSTMLRIRANYTINPETEWAYQATLDFELGRAEGYEGGDPRGMKLSIFQASEEDQVIADALEASFPDGLQPGLVEPPVVFGTVEEPGDEPVFGSVKFYVEGGEETVWRMAQLGLGFETADGERAATLYIPVFSTLEQ